MKRVVPDVNQRVTCGWFEEADQETPLTERPRRSLEHVPLTELQRLDSRLRRAVSMDGRRAVLQGRSKRVLSALLVAKRRRGGDLEDSIQQLIEDISTEVKRQILERVLEMVSFGVIAHTTLTVTRH